MKLKVKITLGLTILLAFSLRLFNLGQNPPSLYWDEASLGYNAFSIAQTLHDEHGEFLPLTRFMAFGDYKAPGYIYADALVVKLFGLNETTTRLPSAIAGTVLVLLTFFITKELMGNQVTALLASVFVAISPWSIQMSRGAFEANLATMFSGLGIYLFLKRRWVLCAIPFTLAMYTFNSHRIFVPLVILALVLIFRPFSRRIILAGIILALLLAPLIQYGFTREARLRLDEVSWLKDVAPIELSNQRIAKDNNSILGKVIHNRRVVYAMQFVKHYTDIWNADFLFFHGDANYRLSTQAIGELYLIDLPLILAGAFFLVKNRNRSGAVLLAWALLAPVPAAFARETPHALRTLNLLPVPQIVAAIGVSQLWRWRYFIAVIFLSLFGYYLRDYYSNYSAQYASSWQYGYKQAVMYVQEHQADYDKISVTGYYGRPYIYFLYYGQYSPEKYWQTRQVDRDWYGFWYVYGFDKYVFSDSEGKQGKWLYLRVPNETPAGAKLLTIIRDPQNKPVFEISEKKY